MKDVELKAGVCPICDVPFDDAHKLPGVGAKFQIPLCLPDERRKLRGNK